VTSVCPESKPILDRSFATEPPQCVFDETPFRITAKTPLGVVAMDAGGEAAKEKSCKQQVADWITSERAARITYTELTQ
jgi:hypothetical protein